MVTSSPLAKTFFVLAIFGLFVYVASPFILPVTMGAVFAVLVHPIFVRMEKVRMPRSLSAFVATAGLTICFVLPVSFIIFFGARTALRRLKDLGRLRQSVPQPGGGESGSFFEAALDSSFAHSVLDWISQWVKLDRTEILRNAQELMATIAIKTGDALASFVTHLPVLMIELALVLIGMYFFLYDGRRLVTFIRTHSFFGKRQTDQLITSFAKMSRSVLLATVISGGAQALLYTIPCLILGIPNVALIAALVFMFSLVPLVGSAPVTLVTLVYYVSTVASPLGTVTLVVFTLLVGVIDNLIRPMVLKGAGELHPLLAFIGAFGGLSMLGVTGVFLGPIIMGMAVATVHIVIDREGV